MKHFLSENTIPKDHIDKLSDWLKTYKRLTQSELVKQFEDKWNKKFNIPYSVFCNSGSSANLLAFSALKEHFNRLGKKLHVAICAAGWSTTLSPLIQLNIPYTFIDIDKQSFTMDMSDLRSMLERGEPITAVVLVHTLGYPNNMDYITQLKKEFDLFIIEDSCPAVGSKIGDKYVGTIGDIGTFSFYYGHQISTIEGGMVSTKNEDIKDLLYMMRNHGWSNDLDITKKRELEVKHNIPEHMSKFTFYVPGYNLRGTELNAFLGLLQIDILDEISNRRHENFLKYRSLLKSYFLVQNNELLESKNKIKVSSITFPVICLSEMERLAIYNILIKNGIETRPISGGNLGSQPMSKIQFTSKMANKLHNCGLVLPCHPEITESEIENISSIVIHTKELL